MTNEFIEIIQGGETRWECESERISITKTKQGCYRVWDEVRLDTVSIEDTLAEAKAVGVGILRLTPEGCGVDESSFTSGECLSCERGFCKFEAMGREVKSADRIRVIKGNPKIAEMIREWAIKKMTDSELADLKECPFCSTSFDLAWTEVDADNFCRVTCAGCEEYLDYNLTKVDVTKSELQELKDKVGDLMVVIGHLYEMREMLRDKVVEMDQEMDRNKGADPLAGQYLSGRKQAFLECLNLLGSTNFKDHKLEWLGGKK